MDRFPKITPVHRDGDDAPGDLSKDDILAHKEELKNMQKKDAKHGGEINSLSKHGGDISSKANTMSGRYVLVIIKVKEVLAQSGRWKYSPVISSNAILSLLKAQSPLDPCLKLRLSVSGAYTRLSPLRHALLFTLYCTSLSIRTHPAGNPNKDRQLKILEIQQLN